MPDTNFDSLYERFNKNICGSSKGYIRQQIVERQLKTKLQTFTDGSLSCADIGGGMGQISQILSDHGHEVDYFDISGAMHTHASNTVKHTGNVHFHNSAFQESLTKHYDLIACQAVLEWLENPLHGLHILCDHLNEGAYLFLLFYNKASISLRNLVRGNLNAALFKAKGNGTGLTPINPLEIDKVFSTLTRCDLELESWFGVRCFTDLQQKETQKKLGRDTLLQFEQAFSERDPYRSIARYVGLFARRKS